MAILGDFANQVADEAQRLTTPEAILGKALSQPFADANSGARKLLYSVQYEHAMPLPNAELPVVGTGYENRYGDLSSSIVKATYDYEVVARIEKFQQKPGFHYYLILRSLNTNELVLFEKCDYKHIGESFGYKFDNSFADSLEIGTQIPKDTIMRRSTSYDEYMNRVDGVNLTAIYHANEITKEDGMWISVPAARKLGASLIRVIDVVIPANYILLNLYGNSEVYKAWPAIGEMIQNGIVFATRQEKTETALYTQAISQLSTVLISDDKYTIPFGRVIDIDIRSNNPETLSEKKSNQQLLYYYNDKIRFMKEFIAAVDHATAKYGIEKWEYSLDKLYNECKRELAGDKFLDNKIYTGTSVRLVIEEFKVAEIGDKITNRYGGKGVISKILPAEEMPRIKTSQEPVEIVINSSTCNNRENIGQWHELSLTHIGKLIIEFAKTNVCTDSEIIQMITKYVAICSPLQAQKMSTMFNKLTANEKRMFIQTILDEDRLHLSLKPISESITLDTLIDLYTEFPWAGPREIEIPIKNSVGTLRWVTARRKITIGTMYMYRLKQYAEEKHSVTSLSATNLRNENSRNKDNKKYRALHQSTPIKFGDMETADFGHMGMEYVISNLMIHSVSPKARRLVEKFYTENPYTVDIKLDSKSSNRSAEQINVYLKALGYRLNFVKKKKTYKAPFTFSPFANKSVLKKPFTFVDEDYNFDADKHYDMMCEAEKAASKYAFTLAPFQFKL